MTNIGDTLEKRTDSGLRQKLIAGGTALSIFLASIFYPSVSSAGIWDDLKKDAEKAKQKYETTKKIYKASRAYKKLQKRNIVADIVGKDVKSYKEFGYFLCWPLDPEHNKISSDYKARRDPVKALRKKKRGEDTKGFYIDDVHNGIDIHVPDKAKGNIYAVGDGVIKKAGGSLNEIFMVLLDDGGRETDYAVRYLHGKYNFHKNKKNPLKKGMKVKQEDIIGIAGNKGYPWTSTGRHLHFELLYQVDIKGEDVWLTIHPIKSIAEYRSKKLKHKKTGERYVP